LTQILGFKIELFSISYKICHIYIKPKKIDDLIVINITLAYKVGYMKFSLTQYLTLSAIVLATAGCSTSSMKKSNYTLKDLQSQKWTLQQIDGKKINTQDGSNAPYLRIDTKMMAVGFSGCNQFFAEAHIKKDKLNINNMNLTRKVCEKSSVNLATKFTQRIKEWNYINIKSNSLTLSSKKNSLTFSSKEK